MLRRLVPGARDLLVLGALGLALTLGIGSEDLWWLLATGRRIAETGQVPRENLFSFTAPHAAWVCHEWGFALAAWWLSQHLGAASLLALRAALFAATLGLVHRATSQHDHVIVPLWISGATFLLLFPQSTLRPWLVANLAFALLLTLLWHRRPWQRHYMAACTVLFLLWTNLHGSWLLGLGTLWLAALRPAPDRRRVLGAAVLSSALTLVNPYGPRLHLLVLDYLHGHAFQAVIVEWGPPDVSEPLTWFFLLHLGLAGWALWRGRRRLPPEGLLVVLLLALLSLRSFRNAGLWAIATALLLAGEPWPLRGWLAARERNYQALARRWPGGLWGWLLGSLGLAAFVWHQRDADINSFTTPQQCPLEETTRLREQGVQRLLAHFQWAGCAIYAGQPTLTVFYDPRNDCYPEAVLLDFLELSTASPGWSETLERYRVQAVLWPEGEPLDAALLVSPLWQQESTSLGIHSFSRRHAAGL